VRAQILRDYGTRLLCEEVAEPACGPQEVLVEVSACGVCAHDLLTRSGLARHPLPCILGHEIAGRVAAVGSLVTGFDVGQRIASVQRRSSCGSCKLCRTGRETLCAQRVFLGQGAPGGFAERVIVAADSLAPVPNGVSETEAALAACLIGTSLNALREVGRLKIGETVLVTGATGGVGLHTVQVARAMGGRVLALVRNMEKASLLSSLGADEVIPMRDGAFAGEVRELTHGLGADLVVDNVGAPVFDEVRRATAVGGRIALVGELGAAKVSFNLAQLFLRGQSLLSVMSTSRAQLVDALELLARGQVRAVVDSTMPLESADLALDRLQRGAPVGRIVLTPGAAQ